MKKDIKRLKEILLNDKIDENIDWLLDNIPELENIINDNNLWEHIKTAIKLAEKNFTIRLAILFHHIGSIYQKEVGNNEELISAYVTYKTLERFNFEKEYIKKICYLINNWQEKILPEEIDENKYLAYQRYLLQYADILAYNQEKNDIKRR